jgi:hypothetical protein
MEQAFFGASGDVQTRRTSAVKPSMNVADNGFPTMLLTLLDDPAQSLLGDKAECQEVVATEGIGGFPFLAVTVRPFKRGVVSRSLVGVVFPNGGTNAVKADFMRGFAGVGWWGIVFHGN